jgi:hypothetical protein
MEDIYFRRCTTTGLNDTLHPTEEPTHNAQANLWRKLHHTFVYCKGLHQFLAYLNKRLQGDLKKQRAASLVQFREHSKQDEEPQDTATIGLM